MFVEVAPWAHRFPIEGSQAASSMGKAPWFVDQEHLGLLIALSCSYIATFDALWFRLGAVFANRFALMLSFRFLSKVIGSYFVITGLLLVPHQPLCRVCGFLFWIFQADLVKCQLLPVQLVLFADTLPVENLAKVWWENHALEVHRFSWRCYRLSSLKTTCNRRNTCAA